MSSVVKDNTMTSGESDWEKKVIHREPRLEAIVVQVKRD